MVLKSALLPLKGTFQCYSWGKDISQSILKNYSNIQTAIPSSGPVAELWLGSHPNGESKIEIDNIWMPLRDHLKKSTNSSKFDFLSKILSINQPLSIQLHPNTEEAIKLHLKDPRNFPDCNPKPEMAIALSNLKLLCGVRPISELSDLIETHPAFQQTPNFNPKKALNSGGISKLFETILSLTGSELQRIIDLFENLEPNTPHDKISKTILNYDKKPDAGILALHLLSYLEIAKGNAIYIKPNIPHAYISGDAFECMKNSDNVVRGGLTSKTLDIENFCRLVETNFYDPKLNGIEVNAATLRYSNGELPFSVDHVELKTGILNSLEIEPEANHEIILVTDGTGELEINNQVFELHPGSSFYSNCRSSMILGGENITLFRIVAK